MLLKRYLKFANTPPPEQVAGTGLLNTPTFIGIFLFFLAIVRQQVYRLRFAQGSRICFSDYFQLMDITGKVAMERILNRNRPKMDISALPAGTYLYRISNQKGLEETGKFVVE